MKQDGFSLDQALVLARTAAAAGSQILLDYFGKLKQVSEKAQAGLVSEADVASEVQIRKILGARWPEIGFLGEEESFAKQNQGLGQWPTSGDWWIVDPLDGTTNYVHCFPVFCVSIGLMRQGRMVLGVIEMPKLGVTYWATAGGGAFVNGRPIRVSERGEVRESLLATGFFRDHPEALEQQLKIFNHLVYEARGIRRAGAAAYDLCLVAEGVFEAFWEKNLKPWDTAAGLVLVQEAGGQVSDYTGAPYDFQSDSIVASNGRLHQKILATISGS